MFLASLFFSAKDWLPVVVGLLVLGVGLLAWGYARVPVAGRLRWTCALLKTLGFLALGICLLEPLWTGQRARPGANQLLLVADNSQGLQNKDRGSRLTRGEALRARLTEANAGWLNTLNENFKVRQFLIDARLQATADFGELDFSGRASALGLALRTLGERYQAQPVAGVVLFTDGNATDIDDQTDFRGLPPVYPVVVGTGEPPRDVAVRRVSVAQTSFEDAPVTVQAEVSAQGYAGQTLVAQLVETDHAEARLSGAAGRPGPRTATNQVARARVVAQQTQVVGAEQQPVSFRFLERPAGQGTTFYRLRVLPQGETGGAESSQEATLLNNERLVAVNRGEGPFRILYVGGRPNWEYKFLHRSVEEDDQVELVGLIRVAKREKKFSFKGRTGESSNPLFRGFDRVTEETERYDQPVLIRLNTRDEVELRDGFPKTAEDLYGYHAVILDDLESGFFTADQMLLLQKFVSDRGGGLLMLGGQESFNQGQYERTAIGAMLPVYLDGLSDPEPLQNLRLTLTREGWLQPWARLRANESEERARLEAMPPFQVMNRTRSIKPGASVLATVQDERGQTFPALVTQAFGRGRTAALTIGDLWRWGVREEAMMADFSKAWRQTLRWLVADVPGRVELRAEPVKNDASGAVRLQVRARDRDFKPLDGATVQVTVRYFRGQPPGVAATNASPAVADIRLTAEAALTEPGLYEVNYVPRDPGGYAATAVVTDANAVEAGSDSTGWTTDFAAEEFASLKPNRELMEKVARQTGGEVFTLDQLEAFVRGLPNRKVPVMESWSQPLWHTPVVFLVALLCFVLEWGLRRRGGMA